MLRITTPLIVIAFNLCSLPLLSQTEISAIARQAYHTQWIESPSIAPSIIDILDSLHWKKEFSAFCPTDGSSAMLIKNKGATGFLTPPISPRHPWEPTSWQENNGTWKGNCPGDSISFLYTPTSQRSGCDPAPDSPPWIEECSEEISPWFIELETELGPSNGSVYTRIGNDGVFDKPIIIVEGFDFGVGGDLDNHRHGNFGFHSLFGCDVDAFPGTEAYPLLLDSLYYLGFDLVFVDFAEGTNSIENKSKLLEKSIELCNTYKQENNALIIAGASMGGIVARYTLRTMEEQGMDHCTRLFIAIDSPHRGANISLGLSGLVSLLSIPSAEAAMFNLGLNSMAAKQLLISSPNGLLEHQSAMQMLADKGLPQKTINVAISNCHPEVEIELDSEPLLHWTESWWWLGSAHLIANRHPSQNGGVAISASCALPVDFIPFNGVELWYEDEVYSYYPIEDLDITPSSIGHHMRLLVDAINASGLMEITEAQFQGEAGFIPAYSALDCDATDINSTNFDFISHATQWNSPEEHVALTLGHRQLVLDKIIQGDIKAPSLLSDLSIINQFTYNHINPSSTWLGSTIVENGGVLQLGETLDLTTPESIEIRTLMCGTTIEINSEGTMNIGGELGLATANFLLEEDSYLYANSESSVNINSGSTMVIKKGAELIIDGTTLEMMSESSLIIEKGGVLRFKNHGNINLEGSGCLLTLRGTIINETNSISSIIHNVNLPSCAQIMIEGHSAKIENRINSKLKVLGNNQLTLSNGSYCSITGDGNFLIDEGTVQINPEAILHQTCKTQLLNTFVSGSNWGVWESKNTLRISESEWDRVALKSSNTRLFMNYNTISRALFKLDKTTFNTGNCNFNYSIFKSTDHPGFNHFFGNNIESEYGLMGGCVEFLFGEHINIQENDFSEGEQGLILDNSKSTLTCNKFSGFDVAITLRGKNYTYMNPESGGGYNLFDNNRVHLDFDCSNKPFISLGKNSFGPYGTYCFKGYMKMTCGNTFNLEENNFNVLQPNFHLYNCTPSCLTSPINILLNQSNTISFTCNDNTVTSDDGRKSNLFNNNEIDMLGRNVVFEKSKPGVFFKRNKDGLYSKYLKLD